MLTILFAILGAGIATGLMILIKNADEDKIKLVGDIIFAVIGAIGGLCLGGLGGLLGGFVLGAIVGYFLAWVLTTIVGTVILYVIFVTLGIVLPIKLL